LKEARKPKASSQKAVKREQSLQDKWAKIFQKLQAYQQEHKGSCNVPQRYLQARSLVTGLAGSVVISRTVRLQRSNAISWRRSDFIN